MRRLLFPGFVMTYLLLCPAAALAIVNVEAVDVGTPTEGFSGTATASAGGASGNSNRFRGRADARLQWHADKHTDFAVFSYDYGTSRGRTDTNREFVHLRHRFQLASAWALEGFVQAERDEFARLSFRGLVGGGLRRTLLEKDAVAAVYLGLGVMFEREILRRDFRTSDPRDESIGRANTYLSMQTRFNAQTHFSSTIFYQPAVADAADFRLLEEAALYVRLADGMDLRLNVEVRYDSRPPQTVKTTDITYTTGITVSF
jgi:putative salt-induced outer membrane protein YdiY